MQTTHGKTLATKATEQFMGTHIGKVEKNVANKAYYLQAAFLYKLSLSFGTLTMFSIDIRHYIYIYM